MSTPPVLTTSQQDLVAGSHYWTLFTSDLHGHVLITISIEGGLAPGGDEVYLQASDPGLRLRRGRRNTDDVYAPIQRSDLEVYLFPGNSSAFEDLFDIQDDELVTNWRGMVRVYTGSPDAPALYWEGLLEDDLWEDQPETPTDVVTLRAGDGLARLQDQTISDLSRGGAISIASRILEVLQVVRPDVSSIDYMSGLTVVGATDDLLDELRVTLRSEEDPDGIQGPYDESTALDTVLKDLLVASTCRIYQENGTYKVRQAMDYAATQGGLPEIQLTDATSREGVRKLQTASITERWANQDVDVISNGDFENTVSGTSFFWDQDAPWTAENWPDIEFTIEPSDGDQWVMYSPEVSTENDYTGPRAIKQRRLATLPQSTQDQSLRLSFDVGVSSDNNEGSLAHFSDPLTDRSDMQDARSFAGPVDVELSLRDGGDTYKLFYAFGVLGLGDSRRFPIETTARKLKGQDVKVPVDFDPTDLPTSFTEGTLLISQGFTSVVRREDMGEWDEVTVARPYHIGDDHIYLDLGESLEKGSLIGFYIWAKNLSITGEQSSIQANNFPVPITPTNDSLYEVTAKVPLHTPSGESVTGSINLTLRRDNVSAEQQSRIAMAGATVLDNIELTAEGVDSRQSGSSQQARGRSWQYESKLGAGPIGIDRSSGTETADRITRAEPHQIAYQGSGMITQYLPEYRITDGETSAPRLEYLTRQILQRQGRTTERRTYTIYLDTVLLMSQLYTLYDGGTYQLQYFEERVGSGDDVAIVEILEHEAKPVSGSQVATFMQTRDALNEGISEIIRPVIFQTETAQVAPVIPQASVSYQFNSRIVGDGGTGVHWSDLTGRPSSILTRDAESALGTLQLGTTEVVEALGYVPFDELDYTPIQDVEAAPSISLDGSLSVGTNLDVGGDILSPVIAGGEHIDPTLAGDVQVSGTMTAQQDLTVQGDLTVMGSRFEANVETVEISDNLAVINSGETGSGVTAGFAGWEVDRGTADNFLFGFDEGLSRFVVGQDGDTQVVATREDSPTDEGLAFFNSSTNRFETDANLTWDGSSLTLQDNLNVTGTATIGGPVTITENNSAGVLRLARGSGNPSIVPAAGENWMIVDGAGSGLGLNYYDDSQVIIANGGGNVGIGTTGPNHRLEVSGGSFVTGDVFVGNDIAANISDPTAARELTVGTEALSDVPAVALRVHDGTQNSRAWMLLDAQEREVVFGQLWSTRGSVDWVFRRLNQDQLRIGQQGDVTFTNHIGTDNYVSQLQGWRVTEAGEADFRSIYSDELTVQTFTAELTQSLAGSDILTKSAADLNKAYSGESSIEIEVPPEAQGAVFSSGDVLRLRVVDRSGGGLNVNDVWLEVVTGLSDSGDVQVFQVNELPGNPSSYTIRKGARVLDYGQPGDTIIERTVNGPGSPFDRIVTWQPDQNGVPSNFTTISQLGNISDQTDAATGIYSASARLTDDIRIGDLSGSYLEFDGSLTIVTAQHGDLDGAISTINTNVSDNSASISAVASTQSDQGTAISALEIDVSSNADGISSNASLINNLQTDLGTVESGLQTQINANESNITSNLGLINSLETDLGNVEAGLQTQIDANATDITSNLNLINTVQTDLGTVEAGLQSQIDANETDITSNLGLINNLETDLGTVESGLQIQINANETDITSNASLINNLQTDLGTVESGLQTQINANESDITSNLSLINSLETDTQTLSTGLELLTQTGQQNLLQYVRAESDLTEVRSQTGGSTGAFLTRYAVEPIEAFGLEIGDTFSVSMELSFEDPQNEGGFVEPFIRALDASGNTIEQWNGSPGGVDTDTGGDFIFAVQEGMVIPEGTAEIQVNANSQNVGDHNIHKARNPMLVRGPKAVGFAYDAQALAAFNLSAENETGLASVEGRVTDAEATLDQTVSYDGNTAGIFLTADGDGSSLELDADQILISGSVTADSIAAGSITADEIAAGAVTANEIQVGALSAENIDVDSVFATNATIDGTLDIRQGTLQIEDFLIGKFDFGTASDSTSRTLSVSAYADQCVAVSDSDSYSITPSFDATNGLAEVSYAIGNIGKVTVGGDDDNFSRCEVDVIFKDSSGTEITRASRTHYKGDRNTDFTSSGAGNPITASIPAGTSSIEVVRTATAVSMNDGSGGCTENVANFGSESEITVSNAQNFISDKGLVYTFGGNQIILDGEAGTIEANTKNFLIDHPTKQGYKLRHSTLEGPEQGTYHRGTTNASAFTLPEYWATWDDYTVHLTAQEQGSVWVEAIDDGVVQVGQSRPDIEYSYLVIGKRADIVVEEVI